MKHYCTFVLRADNKKAAAQIFPSPVVHSLDFEDEQSAARLASSKRMQAAGIVFRNDLPRYTWQLNTRQVIGTNECDPLVHVSWLLSQLKPGILLSEARDRGIESSLAFYWGGNGTGGGPFISRALAELLVRYQVGLDVGFYYEDNTHVDKGGSAA